MVTTDVVVYTDFMNDIQKFTAVLFTLNDNRLVLQRRTADAPYAPGLLGAFGGWMEANETVDQSMLREVGEETSLDITMLEPTLIAECLVDASEDFPAPRYFYIYKVPVTTMDFDVYEGDRAEAYTLEELRLRTDLSGALSHTLDAVRTVWDDGDNNYESESA